VLVLYRKSEEGMMVGGAVRIPVATVHESRVEMGFTAPAERAFLRDELCPPLAAKTDVSIPFQRSRRSRMISFSPRQWTEVKPMTVMEIPAPASESKGAETIRDAAPLPVLQCGQTKTVAEGVMVEDAPAWSEIAEEDKKSQAFAPPRTPWLPPRGEKPGKLVWNLYTTPARWSSSEVRTEWKRLLAQSANLEVVYQSPEWFDHLNETSAPGRRLLAVARDPAGQLMGLAPLNLGRGTLPFVVSGLVLGTVSFPELAILGGQPLLPEVAGTEESLIATLRTAFPRCAAIDLGAIAKKSYRWQRLQESPIVQASHQPYVMDGFRECHVLPLPETFEEYLGKFSSKRRYNLKRQVRLLREQGGGKLTLQRVDGREQVWPFLEGTRELLSRSGPKEGVAAWMGERPGLLKRLFDQAERGLLRSYLMHCGDVCVGCVCGRQYRDTYYFDASTYHQEWARFSPGTVLLHLIIEDLIRGQQTRLIHFGFGEPYYEHSATNLRLERGCVKLFQKTVANRLRLGAHSAFQSAAHFCKEAAIRMGLKRGKQRRN
jgi:CelD/BcsL family acetyltransferase involved in cellulose biosynthesis/sRNA-binding carbon storage regulator CsrA